jgi:hypothetical protein
MPIFVGGMMRALGDRITGHKGSESEVSSGMLYSTGLVAGGALTGVLIAALAGIPVTVDGQQVSLIQRIFDLVGVHEWARLGAAADIIGVVMFAGLCYLLLRAAREKLT